MIKQFIKPTIAAALAAFFMSLRTPENANVLYVLVVFLLVYFSIFFALEAVSRVLSINISRLVLAILALFPVVLLGIESTGQLSTLDAVLLGLATAGIAWYIERQKKAPKN